MYESKCHQQPSQIYPLLKRIFVNTIMIQSKRKNMYKTQLKVGRRTTILQIFKRLTRDI